MSPPMRVVTLLLAALVPAAPGAVAEEDRVGGECSSVVDVDCDDYYEDCGPHFSSECQERYQRSCLVWVMYLDMTFPVEDERYVCHDNPYYGWY